MGQFSLKHLFWLKLIINCLYLIYRSNNKMSNEIDFHKKTVGLMIVLYCNNLHKNSQSNKTLCSDCFELKKYSELKLDRCPFGNNKPACTKCITHCFKPLMREKIKTVMKYSGKRMLFSYPVISVKYLYYKLRHQFQT